MSNALIRSSNGTIPYVNGTGSTITSGSIINLGSARVGVAAGDIASGATGIVHVQGVFRLPKATGFAVAQQATIHWDVSAGNCNTTASGVGDLQNIGRVAKAAASGDVWVDVELNVPTVITVVAS